MAKLNLRAVPCDLHEQATQAFNDGDGGRFVMKRAQWGWHGTSNR